MVKALKVPFEFDPSGRTAKVEGEWPVMATYVRTLLLTRVGERVMRPTYGSPTADAAFEPMGEQFRAEIDGDIRDAIVAWEPGVEVMGVDVDEIGSMLTVKISFRVRSNLSGDTSVVLVEIDRGGTTEERSQ